MTTDGLVVVDKPAGLTSHDVVGRCRKLFAQKRVGHAGTLDPDATGVLLVGLGRATRLLRYLSGLSKAYRTEIVLGTSTSTLDSSGEVTGTWDMSAVGVEAARRAAATLTGHIDQVPPMVSAVKVGGRRLYQLARAGVEVERAARRVEVRKFELGPSAGDPAVGSAAGGSPVFDAYIECSTGTYVRVLADDLGRALGGGAHVRNLRRVSVGPWSEAAAVPLDRLGPDDVISPGDALPWMQSVVACQSVEAAVRHGRVMPEGVLGVEGPGPWRVLGASGQLLAVYEAHGEGLSKPAVVVAAGAE